ncbi:YARHG domain-containing protein [Aquimarina litoralis]|uniref:YARHG domain-containing protein n=1 Tax=Aquimarina litoralis TaxID=584605 RepID=UPI001C572FCD|nr:YARHG domain-containing protein [Aquimarina litoralis]MBW1297710.1 YARHG domain-containing protein [Aquimarina litoralis]
MQRITLVCFFLLIAFGIHAEPFFRIFPDQLNFENYPNITTTCFIRNEGNFRMTKSNIDKFNFSLIENGIYIPEVTYELIQVLDSDESVVKLSYTTMSPLYMHRDITFFLNAEDHFTFDGENYIFYNNGTIVDYEMNPYSVHKNLTQQEPNQNTILPNPSLHSDKSLMECSSEELFLMRNEYYAQKGYIFKEDRLRDYFSTQKWYSPTVTNSKQIIFSDEEKAEIAYIQYYEQLKSNTNFPIIDTIEYYGNGMIKSIVTKTEKNYQLYQGSNQKKQILINSSFISFNKEQRQPSRIGYFNLYHKQERFRDYYINGIVSEELFIRNEGDLDRNTTFVDKYYNTGKKRSKSEFRDNLSSFEIESLKNDSEWYIVWEYYIKNDTSSISQEDIYKYRTVYDVHSPQTPTEQEMNKIVNDSLITDSENEYDFNQLKVLYQQEYPKNNGIEVNAHEYIKNQNEDYLHVPNMYNNMKYTLLSDKHEVSYVYISMTNKRYEQKLYEEKPVLLEEESGLLYDDSVVHEINGNYKIQNWNAEKKQLEYIDIFHPDMKFGTYVMFMKITFPEHKKMFYSDKYKLIYVPLEEELIDESNNSE